MAHDIRYEDMTVAELEQILWRDDPHTDAEGLTEEEAELILRWIEQKDPNYFAGLPTPEEAWQHLEQRVGHLDSARKRRNRAFLRRRRHGVGLLVALLAALFVGALLTCYASGIDPVKKVAEWTDEAFQLKAEESTIYMGRWGDMTDEEAWDLLMPTWLPEGYERSEPKINRNEASVSYYVEYWNSEEELLSIVIRRDIVDGIRVYEKDERPVEEYVYEGITHYIMHNLDRITAVWIYEDYECSISGPVTQEEMKQILRSVYEK